MPTQQIRIASTGDFKKKNPIKFTCGPHKEGFVVCWKNRFFGYENVCRHQSLPLDYGDGGFFSPDGKSLLCRNHGAETDTATGLCIRGPCEGASLRPLKVVVNEETVWVEIEELSG